MEVRIQLEKNLISDDVIGSLVFDESKNLMVGEIISYDNITGIGICELYDEKSQNQII